MVSTYFIFNYVKNIYTYNLFIYKICKDIDSKKIDEGVDNIRVLYLPHINISKTPSAKSMFLYHNYQFKWVHRINDPVRI